jgi:hypothetical protein
MTSLWLLVDLYGHFIQPLLWSQIDRNGMLFYVTVGYYVEFRDEIRLLCRYSVLPPCNNDTTMSIYASWVLCTAWGSYESICYLSGSDILRKLVCEGVVGWSCFLCLLWWAACDPMVFFQSTRGLSSIMNSNQLCRYHFSACGATVKMVDFIMIYHRIVGSINISKISSPSISFRLQSFIPMITLCEA